MTAAPLTSLAAACAALVLVLAPAPAQGAADPAEVALRLRDAYASPRALGPGAGAAEARLAEAAALLERQGRPVELAVVAGPSGAPSMRAYAAGLRRALGSEETVVVTAPDRPVVAVGPRSPAEVTRRLRAAGAGRLGDPVARVIAAARAAAPPARAPGSNLREIGVLLGIAVLGGLWAVAIGLRRERRRADAGLGERRGALRVHLDALGAQADALEPAAHDAAVAEELRAARAAHGAAATGLMAARDDPALDSAGAAVAGGLAAVDRARAAAGLAPLADPFEGLCATDPAHGAATGASAGGPDALCAACRAAAQAGRRPEPRLVAVGGVPMTHRAAPGPDATSP